MGDRPVCFISVAGMQDPHVLLGHDFTYTGSKPGKIVQEIVDAKCLDPVMIFDEIDKAGGKVQNALMSLLDPLQNHAYKDAFLGNVPIDLSRIFFVMTCNVHGDGRISSPLLDRMRMVRVPSLSEQARLDLIQGVIVPKVMRNIFEFQERGVGEGKKKKGEKEGYEREKGDEKDLARDVCEGVCDREMAREILVLSQEQNRNEDGEEDDGRGKDGNHMSLRCIENTAHKVALEFVKEIMKRVNGGLSARKGDEEVRDGKDEESKETKETKEKQKEKETEEEDEETETETEEEEEEEEEKDIKMEILSFIRKNGCRMTKEHVQACRKAFEASAVRSHSIFLSYLYT